MAALRVGRLDFLRRRAVIAESVTLVRPSRCGDAEGSRAARGADSAVPCRRARRACRRQGARRPGVHRRPRSVDALRPGLPPRASTAAAEVIGCPACIRTSCGTPPQPRDRLRGRREGCAADARPQVGDDDSRPVRPSLRRPTRRCRRRMDAAEQAAVARMLPKPMIVDLESSAEATPTNTGPLAGAPGRIRTCAPASGGRCSIP